MVCFRLRRRSKVYIYLSFSLCACVNISLYIHTNEYMTVKKKVSPDHAQVVASLDAVASPRDCLAKIEAEPSPSNSSCSASGEGDWMGRFFFPVDDVILVICNRRFDHQHVGDTVICEHLNHEHISFKLSKCHLIIF